MQRPCTAIRLPGSMTAYPIRMTLDKNRANYWRVIERRDPVDEFESAMENTLV
jgi:hypothetical protein